MEMNLKALEMARSNLADIREIFYDAEKNVSRFH